MVLILVFSIPSTAILPARGSSNREASENSIDWYSFEEGKEEAEKSGKPIFIYFMTDTCGFCQKMEEETFMDENVQNKADEVIFIKVNAVDRSDLVEQYGISGVPSLFFENSDGEEIETQTGFMSSSELVEKLNNVYSSTDSTNEPATEDPSSDSDEKETPFWRSLLFLEIILSISTAIIIILVWNRVKGNPDE